MTAVKNIDLVSVSITDKGHGIAFNSGLGDTVEMIIHKIIKPQHSCDNCKARKEKLNKLFPYKRKQHGAR